jgi:ACS family tartrate transporter-like MFS transporter
MPFRFGASRWIARIMLSWGVCAAAMAFVVGPMSFYAMRLLLGAAEAGFFPGVLFFLPLILKGFGMTNMQTGLVAAIPSAIALVAVIWWGRRSDARRERYGHAAFANFLGGAALLASVLVAEPAARIALITVAFSATLAFTAPFWTIPSLFLSGAASAGGFAAISALGVLGGFVAPSIIGYLGSVTGDFHAGLGGAGVLAMVLAAAFYLVARKQPAVPVMPAGAPLLD